MLSDGAIGTRNEVVAATFLTLANSFGAVLGPIIASALVDALKFQRMLTWVALGTLAVVFVATLYPIFQPRLCRPPKHHLSIKDLEAEEDSVDDHRKHPSKQDEEGGGLTKADSLK